MIKKYRCVSVVVVVVVGRKTLYERKYHDNMSNHELFTGQRGSDINFHYWSYAKTMGIFTN